MDTFPSLSCIRGDTPEWSDKFFDRTGAPLDLSGVTIWLTVKSAVDNSADDSTALLRLHLAVGPDGTTTSSHGMRLGGIDPDPESVTYGQEVSGAASGVVTYLLPQEDSTALLTGTFTYDIQVETAQDPPRYRTIVRDAPFVVSGDITRRITTP